MMWRCVDCGYVFDDAMTGYEWHGEYVESYGVCTRCASDQIEEVVECRACGVGYATIGGDYCEECERDFELLMNEVKKSMGIDEKTLIDMMALYIEGR